MSLTLKSGHIPFWWRHIWSSPRVKKIEKFFFAFFYELKHSDSKNAIKNFWPENFHCEVTLVRDLEFFWVQNYEMSYEVLHSHPLTLVCFNIFVHYLFLIRWLIRGIILHLQYSDGISHSMNQLLGVSSFWYVNNRFRSCDLNFGSGPVMTLSTKWCSVMNLFHWIHFWRVPWRVMSFLHFHFQIFILKI